MKLVRVRKLKEAENPKHPNNIEVGFEKIGEFIEEPEVGESFWVGGDKLAKCWATSTVQEILSENTFRTYNSIYQWELIEN